MIKKVFSSSALLQKTKMYMSNLLILLPLFPVILIIPFKNGLYFDKSFHWAAFYILLVSIVGLVIILTRNNVVHSKPTRFDIAFLSLFFIYFLFLWITAANKEYAIEGFIRQSSYVLFFYIIRFLINSEDKLHAFIDALMLSGVIFSIYGLANGFGSLKIHGAIMGGPTGDRLASVFEYSNAFAVYQGALMILGAGILTTLTKYSRVFYYQASMYFIMISFIFTFSRGAWVLWGISLLGLVLVIRGYRMQMVFRLLPVLGGVIAVSSIIGNSIVHKTTTQGWMMLALGMMLVGVLSFVFTKIEKRVSLKKIVETSKFKIFAVLTTIVVITATIIAMPSTITQRIMTINLEQFSAVQRIVFFKDGLKAVWEAPLLGQGANAWNAAFQQYQSYPYWSKQSHSLVIDLLMDVGLVGTLFFSSLLVMTVISLIKSRKEFAEDIRTIRYTIGVAILFLLAHASLDFDFWFGSISFLFWGLLALLAPTVTFVFRKKNIMSAISREKLEGTRWAFYVLLLISVIPLVILIAGYYENTLNEQAADLKRRGFAQVALKKMNAATTLASYRPNYWLTVAELEEEVAKRTGKAVSPNMLGAAKKATEVAPKNPVILIKASKYYAKYNEGLTAVDLAKKAFEVAPYTMVYPEQYMLYSHSAGTQLLLKKPESGRQYEQDVYETFENVTKRIEGFKNLPPVLKLEREYEITPLMRLVAAEAAFILKKDTEAAKIVEPNIRSKKLTDQEHLKTVVLHQAIIEKSGKSTDLQEYNRLIKLHPELVSYKKELDILRDK